MKGKIELYYALPNLDAYLKEKGIDESQLQPLIHLFVSGAAEHYMEANLADIEGVIGEALQNEGLDTITKGKFEDLTTAHCKLIVDKDEHILDRQVLHATKRRKK